MRSMAENLELFRARIADLERAMGLDIAIPQALGLGPVQCRIVCVLLEKGAVSKEALHLAVYDVRRDADVPSIKSLDVQICKIRPILLQHGIEIRTLWAHGWELPPESLQRARALVGWRPASERRAAA